MAEVRLTINIGQGRRIRWMNSFGRVQKGEIMSAADNEHGITVLEVLADDDGEIAQIPLVYTE